MLKLDDLCCFVGFWIEGDSIFWMARSEQVLLGYCPHPAQAMFHGSCARFRCLGCGRQFGKTKAGSNELLKMAVDCSCQFPRRVVNGVVGAPTYWHLQRCWDGVLDAIGLNFKAWNVQVHKAEHYIEVPANGGIRLWFRSAEDPNAFRSQTWDFGWFDECAFMPVAAWHSVEPALMGRMIFTTTFWGHNWFLELCARGEDPSYGGVWESWRFPTSANPYYPREKIEEARATLPEAVFMQEYMAVPMEDVGAVFRNVDDYVVSVPGRFDGHGNFVGEVQGGEQFVVSSDLAKARDFQVNMAMDFNGTVRGFERYNELSWDLQKARLAEFCRRYNRGRLLIDSTGLGDPIYDEMRNINLYGYDKGELHITPNFTSGIDGYKFTNASKADLVENLSIGFDKGKYHYPKIQVMLNELHTFGYELGKTGTMIYRAAEGCHDDSVIALALDAWQNRRPCEPDVGVAKVRW